jgi:hypothetical protein
MCSVSRTRSAHPSIEVGWPTHMSRFAYPTLYRGAQLIASRLICVGAHATGRGPHTKRWERGQGKCNGGELADRIRWVSDTRVRQPSSYAFSADTSVGYSRNLIYMERPHRAGTLLFAVGAAVLNGAAASQPQAGHVLLASPLGPSAVALEQLMGASQLGLLLTHVFGCALCIPHPLSRPSQYAPTLFWPPLPAPQRSS